MYCETDKNNNSKNASDNKDSLWMKFMEGLNRHEEVITR